MAGDGCGGANSREKQVCSRVFRRGFGFFTRFIECEKLADVLE